MKLQDIRDDLEILGHLGEESLAFMESVATHAEFAEGEALFEEDAVANVFYVILEGMVGLELVTPGQVPFVLQTLRDGDLIGVSWLFPPHRWSWRARALVPTKTVAFDAEAVRDHLEADCELERQLLRAVAQAAATRLHSSRTQLLDLYGARG